MKDELIRMALMDARDFVRQLMEMVGSSRRLSELAHDLEYAIAASRELKPKDHEERPPIFPADWLEENV